MISANGVEYKNLPEQVQYLTERAAEFAVELNRVSTSLEGVTTNVEGLQTDVAALQTSYTALAEDVRIAKVNINTIFGNLGTIFTDITNIKNGTTHLFETITDRHGNPRFVEGDITMNTIEGVTQIYGKWSLSGTHLMMIIMFDIDNGITTPANADLAVFSLPDYIYAKIYPLGGQFVNAINVVVREKNTWYNSKTLQLVQLYRVNNSAKEMVIRTSGSTITTNAVSAARIQFDVIIDAS